jgi:tripartite-type tricarboxylate transporter receptor subunit TctC
VSVPYKGGGPSFTELIGGHIPIAFESGLQGISSVRAGKVRALAVLSVKPSPLLPGVPTMAETLPGYELVNWFALATPAATPRDIVGRLHAEITRALKAPDVRDKLQAQGAEPVGSSPDEMTAFLKSETAKWSRVIREAAIRAQ